MAVIPNNNINVDNFFTDTRVAVCMMFNCKHHMGANFGCNFKSIQINEFGVCKNIADKEGGVNAVKQLNTREDERL